MHWTASSADTHFGSRSNTCETWGVYVKYVFGPNRPVSEFHILALSPILFTTETDIAGGWCVWMSKRAAEGWWEDNQNDESRARFSNLYWIFECNSLRVVIVWMCKTHKKYDKRRGGGSVGDKLTTTTRRRSAVANEWTGRQAAVMSAAGCESGLRLASKDTETRKMKIQRMWSANDTAQLNGLNLTITIVLYQLFIYSYLLVFATTKDKSARAPTDEHEISTIS